MAARPVGGGVLLFGGRANTILGDTWEWDGASWRAAAPASTPPSRYNHAMACDRLRQRVVLFGGSDGAGSLRDTWEWDGVTWSRLSGSGREDCPMEHDVARGINVLFGNQPATALLGPVTAAGGRRYGFGCAGTSGTPALAAFGLPYLGNPDLALDIVSARAAATLAVLLASAPDVISLAGTCRLLVDPTRVAVALPAVTNAAGFATLPLPIPPVWSLSGASIYAQAAVVDPAGGSLGVALTQGLTLTLGY